MKPLLILSLGAGVQSTTLALMAKHGEIEMPDHAIFADTGAEPKGVYEHLQWLTDTLRDCFPVHVVKEGAGLLKHLEDSVANGSFAGAPFYTESDSGTGGTLRRQCTREFKLHPILQKTRRLLGLKKGERAPRGGVLVRQFIGISLDEVTRMKPSDTKWIQNEWPLIDKRMSRYDCYTWLRTNGYPKPPKSACTFCPYHNDGLWADMKRNDKESWNQAVEIDRMIRSGVRGTKQKLYLHQTLKPLEDVDFSTEEDRGQINLFENECEGMCGV